jgi:hypothetical protein
VEPFSVLELVVGAGGGGGVCGTELQTVDITEQRRRMALRRDKEVHLLKGEKMVHRDDDEYAVALLMEESCGVTPGGAPGGEFVLLAQSSDPLDLSVLTHSFHGTCTCRW